MYAELYEPAPADSDANGNGAPAATGSESSDRTKIRKSKPHAYKMFCRPCRASYSVTALMRLPDRGLFQKYSKGPFFLGLQLFIRADNFLKL